MNLPTIVSAFAIWSLGILAVYFLVAAIRVLRSDPSEYRRNRLHSKNISSVLRGKLTGGSEGQRDSVVQAGIAIDRRNNWSEQGRISEDSILNIIRR